MEIIHAIVLGVVEGITEFLPISSTAHMDIARALMQVEATPFVKSFEIAIQFGAILSVVWLFREKIFSSFPLYFKNIMIAFIPTGIVGFLLYKIIKTFLLGNLWIAGAALLVGGIKILFFENLFAKRVEVDRKFETLSTKELLFMGLAQSIAVIPGVSRSLAVILSGRLMGVPKILVTEFSFLLAIPTMFAAASYDLYKSGFAFQEGDWMALAVGFVVSFVVALFSVKWLIKYVENHSFSVFGWYRIVIGLLILFFIL